MQRLNITIREGRTADCVYKDAALVYGYEPTLSEKKKILKEDLTEAEKDAYAYPDNIVEGTNKVNQYTKDDGSVTYSIAYDILEVTDNPETDLEFGKKYIQKKFAEIDAKIASEAELHRAKAGYGIE